MHTLVPTASRPEIPDHVTQAVDSVASMHMQAQTEVSRHQRTIEALSAALGRPGTLYVTMFLVAAWVVVNTCASANGGKAVDPAPFGFLQGVTTLSSLLMTIVILTTQNRQTRHAEVRARLDLQVNLLAEAKVAKLIALVEELRRDLPSVPNRVDREAEAMQTAVDPAQVMTALEETLEVRTLEASKDTEADLGAESPSRARVASSE